MKNNIFGFVCKIDREEALNKKIVPRVVFSITLNGNKTFLEWKHFPSLKIEVVGGLPNPPPEGNKKGGG